MSANTNEKKIRISETFKRLINLGLIAVCLALEVADFGYHWFVDFQYSVVEQLRDFWYWGHRAEIAFYILLLTARTAQKQKYHALSITPSPADLRYKFHIRRMASSLLDDSDRPARRYLARFSSSP